MTALTLGFSPCPNDTFIFHALVHGLVAADLSWDVRLADVEALNRAALADEVDVTKLSYHAFLHVSDRYVMLPAGGALGRGVGPLVVTKKPLASLRGATVATPGGLTTANLLLALWQPEDVHTVETRYDRIMPAVASGAVDAGLIIHESRFTYRDHGLIAHEDLGSWWERTTGYPIPLGGIAVRRGFDPVLVGRVNEAVRDSLLYARRDPAASRVYVAAHAQEMSPAVRERHIELYVNELSLDVGASGREAVAALAHRAATRGLVTTPERRLFADVG